MEKEDLEAPIRGHQPLSEEGEILFRKVDRYPWASDTEFQTGLHAILGSNPSPEERYRLTLRARCFYYSRYHFSGFSLALGLMRPQHLWRSFRLCQVSRMGSEAVH